MDYKTIDLTLISAQGLKKATLFGKSDVYAVVYISGATSNQKLRTPVDKKGGSNPTWNASLRFTLDNADILHKRLDLVIEIKAAGRIFSDENLGQVRCRINFVDLPPGPCVSPGKKGQEFYRFPVIKPSGKPQGFLSFSTRVGKNYSGNTEKPVTSCPPQPQQQPKKNKAGQIQKKKKKKGAGN